MGYYIETGHLHHKADDIIREYGAVEVTQAQAKLIVNTQTDECAVIVVVENGPFDAAAFAFDAAEFDAFTYPSDTRPKRFLTLPWATACRLTRYT